MSCAYRIVDSVSLPPPCFSKRNATQTVSPFALLIFLNPNPQFPAHQKQGAFAVSSECFETPKGHSSEQTLDFLLIIIRPMRRTFAASSESLETPRGRSCGSSSAKMVAMEVVGSSSSSTPKLWWKVATFKGGLCRLGEGQV